MDEGLKLAVLGSASAPLAVGSDVAIALPWSSVRYFVNLRRGITWELRTNEA